ncbi:FG-GAP-like repeat-containing protein [Rubripirellula reticaptiva]|uniref:FG-GAP-like repeat-containing protein n=1 Tax=Rubripirellula reticaptiva TaxID=2528013 RepID=UPI0016495DA6|nr:FG-GAP-like repeat-containing protein [Rubripirellula reticaptiva]
MRCSTETTRTHAAWLLLFCAFLGCRPAAPGSQLSDTPSGGQIDQDHRTQNLNDDLDAVALERAGDSASARSAHDQAIAYYQRAIEMSPQPTAQLLDKVGRQWVTLGRPFEALQVLESLVETFPDDAARRADLAGLQGSLGLEYRAAEHLQYLVQHQMAGVNELIMLTDLTRPQTDKAICEYALKHYPADSRPKYSLARSRAYEGKWADIVADLNEVCEQYPDFIEAWAYYGRALVELDDRLGIQAWSKKLPSGIETEPCYWLAAGQWAKKQGDMAAAANAFWHAAERNPNDGEALTQLAACLTELGRINDSQRVNAAAGLVTAMRDDVEGLFSWRNHSQRASVRIAKSMQKLGRTWEAATWARIAVVMTQDPDDSANEVFAQIRATMTGKTPWQSSELMVTRSIDVSNLPLPEWTDETDRLTSGDAESSGKQFHFVDEAAMQGLDHVCKIDKGDGTEAGLCIYQSGAGGAGVIDFDRDGWPDFYLTSSDGVPKQSNSSPNRLHRNLDGRFADVTKNSGTGDQGFAQGVSVGDYDSDGFADLYVGNFGTNRLLRNNGDGTFTDVTTESGLSGAQWTTSVALTDFNNDAIADLYEVNYIAGDEVLTQKCLLDGGQEHRSCGPLVFAAEPDRVWRGVGDGTFIDATEDWLDEQSPGRGLGIVVGELDNQPGMDAYIANDMTANQLWSAQTPPAEVTDSEGSAPFRMIEQAAIRGLAFNARSLSQASMGIAADDYDNDGDVDFYVSHFTDDYNTLYDQVSPGIWADRTTAADMVTPTLSMLGYGTQWIDADNDGQLELAVANGNVDDFTHNDKAYRMQMMLYHRQNDGRFTEVNSSTLGPYFDTKRLGRALVRVDANRDQQTDLLVTHLFDPVALLINTSESIGSATDTMVGNSVTFYLVARHSHRDAIGAHVSIEFGEQSRTRQLLAGDGYQCSNERCLTFGLGDADVAKRVTIDWPSGHRQTVTNVATNTAHIVVEGIE